MTAQPDVYEPDIGGSTPVQLPPQKITLLADREAGYSWLVE